MNFVTQIAALVRNMTDTELCSLALKTIPQDVLDGKVVAETTDTAAKKPEVIVESPTTVTAPPAKKRGRPAGKVKGKPGRPAGSKNKAKADDAPDPDQDLMMNIEMHIRKSTEGFATSAVAEQFKIEKEKAAHILKKLVIAGRIFRGGEKRFSRYAKDQKTANESSLASRSIAPMAE